MPEAKVGKCEWCGRNDQWVIRMPLEYEGRTVFGWTCGLCHKMVLLGMYDKQEEMNGNDGSGTDPAEH